MFTRRILDDVVQEVAQHASELGPGAKAELDQVAAVDREIREPVRLPPLGLEPLAEARELLEILDGRPEPVRSGLAAVVGVLVVDELERELVAVLREKPPRAQRVAFPDLEHVVADDPNDAVAQRVRIAQPEQRLSCELAADLLVAPVGEAGFA